MQFNQLWEKHFREFQERRLTLPDGSSLVLVGVCGKDYASELSTNKVAEFLQEQRWRRGIVYIGLGIRCFGRDMSADEEAEVLRSYPADKLASDPLNIDCRFFQSLTFMNSERSVERCEETRLSGKTAMPNWGGSPCNGFSYRSQAEATEHHGDEREEIDLHFSPRI